MKSVKTIKEEIFESLNRSYSDILDENIQLKPALQNKPNQLNKNSSYSVLHNTANHNPPRSEEMETVIKKIKELEAQLADANQ
jgi:uncharacterized coiled-coil DUF342 family protein